MVLSAYDTACILSVRTFIDTHLQQHYPITQLALQAGIGTTKLKKGFRQIYGMGLYQYLRIQRLQNAALLLSDPAKTIKQVARATGYRYTTNFNTAFSRYHGITPHLYRKGLPK